jgi:hypothetical protein
MMKRQLFLPISVHQASVWPGEFVVLVEWVLPAAFSHCVAVAPSPPSLLETSATEPLVSCLFSSLPLHSSLPLLLRLLSLCLCVSLCVLWYFFFPPLTCLVFASRFSAAVLDCSPTGVACFAWLCSTCKCRDSELRVVATEEDGRVVGSGDGGEGNGWYGNGRQR